MPSIELEIQQLEEAVGKELDLKELEYDLQWISLDIDDINKEEETIKVEFNPNRPDFSSPEGIARALKGYYDLEKGLPKFEVKEGEQIMNVSPKVREVRPFVACGRIIFDEPLTERQVVTLMHMQEILHWALGRDRRKVAIGIHDWEAVKGPYKYTTVKPEEIKFRPLHLEAYELTPQEILEEHPMGIQYAHLVEDFDEYPMIFDAEDKVVSFPPIINGVYTTVTPKKTRILLLDLTGTDKSAVDYATNILATTFADMGGTIETAKVIYEDKPEEEVLYPRLKTQEWDVHVDYINSYIGLDLDLDEMIECFEKVRMQAEKTDDDNILKVTVPPYRVDIMHEVDFTEEVAIGYGYQNLPISIKAGGVGAYNPYVDFGEKSRKIILGAKALEMVNLILCARSDIEKLNLEVKDENSVIIANPVSKEYNTTRKWILAGLMRNLQENRSAEKPFRLFEVGDVVVIDKSRDTGARRELHLACVVHGESSDYTEIKSILDHYFRTLGLLDSIEISAVEHNTFVPGRTGEIHFNGDSIGYIGEIHPKVVLNFGLEYPTAAFEINLNPLIKNE